MIEQLDYTPEHKSQFHIINQYRKRLEALNPEAKLRIKPITYKEGNDVIRGFRIILNKNENKLVSNGLITDWDDTLENYSNRKPKYFASLFQLAKNKNDITQNQFTCILKSINRAARVLNWQETHPENYSPFLEMITETQLLTDFDTSSNEGAFLNLLNSPTETSARQYIEKNIVPKFGGALQKKQKKQKTYFKESQHQSLAYILEKKHNFISEEVWSRFNQTMTEPNLTLDDINIFDLDDSTYWAISTFGVVEFQIKKILNSLELLAAHGKRMPNEIMIITHGRKKQALLEIIEENPNIDWTYVDDSERQLKEIASANKENLNPISAKRPKTKRYDEESEFDTTSMTEPLSAIVS